jgi:hypothetical protein
MVRFRPFSRSRSQPHEGEGPEEAPSARERIDPVVRTGSQPSRWPRPLAGRGRLFRIVGAGLIAALVLTLVRFTGIATDGGGELQVRIGTQAPASVDLRQGVAMSPYLFGTNVFPESGTSSVDRSYTGFMSYAPPISEGLRDAKVGLLRFPGGKWGEDHVLSLQQLNAFSDLLSRSGSQGMVQASLTSGGHSGTHLASLADRANTAGHWVDYMNNPHSTLRTGVDASAPFHPVHFWTVGNEPDQLMNPDTKKLFTVAEYVNAFVLFSIAMHQNGPTIQVFGPELSQFYGIGVGPKDASGQLWMEGFLNGVEAYQKAHPEIKFHLVDGISFHFYPAGGPQDASTALMANAQEWNYLLTPLRQLARDTLDRETPVAVTEINSNATGESPPQGLAALWWADTLGTLMNQAVDYVAFFSAEGVDSPLPLFSSTGLRQTSMLRVLQLFSHLQHNLIPVVTERDPISLYATQDDAHRAVSLLFVNKAPWNQLAQLTDQNQVFGINSWPDLNLSLPGYSITLITLHRGGRAEAYTFKASSGQNGNQPPLVHTICGHKFDALAHDIPC